MVHVAVVAAPPTYNYITFLLDSSTQKTKKRQKRSECLPKSGSNYFIYIYTINQ